MIRTTESEAYNQNFGFSSRRGLGYNSQYSNNGQSQYPPSGSNYQPVQSNQNQQVPPPVNNIDAYSSSIGRQQSSMPPESDHRGTYQTTGRESNYKGAPTI